MRESYLFTKIFLMLRTETDSILTQKFTISNSKLFSKFRLHRIKTDIDLLYYVWRKNITHFLQ